MRDAADQETAELPTFPPMPRAPVIERRVNIAKRREFVGYVPPKRVESCRNCKHVRAAFTDPNTIYQREAHACAKHGFYVLLGAICRAYRDREA